MADDQSSRPTGQAAPAAPPPPAPEPAPAPRSKLRGRLFAGLGTVVVLGALGFGGWWLLVGSRSVDTDNAYVGADVAQVTPLIAAPVAEVRVADTQSVKAGDVLVVLDGADAKLALAQAEAEYGRARRRVEQYFATNDTASAEIAARSAELAKTQAQTASAEAELEKSRVDLQRREALSASGAVSGEEVTSARTAFASAQAALASAKAASAEAAADRTAAQARLTAQQVLTRNADVDTNPETAAAKAAVDTAKLNLDRAVVRAPVSGVVARRQVQVGQRVAIGAPLMTIVPTQDVYVDANFKEVQLRKVRVGQTATLTSDLYGDDVVFHGKVAGIGGGTGSAFAVIPAQNATGNWIKVVQRLPVRIQLDPKEVAAHPLRVGLSMKAKIDITRQGG